MAGHCCKKRRRKRCKGCMLNDMECGRRTRVQRHHATGAVRQRLLNLGFTRDAEVSIIGRAPFGDPIQCRVANCCVTLPCSEAALIEVDND